jgi:hypothetical protein
LPEVLAIERRPLPPPNSGFDAPGSSSLSSVLSISEAILALNPCSLWHDLGELSSLEVYWSKSVFSDSDDAADEAV